MKSYVRPRCCFSACWLGVALTLFGNATLSTAAEMAVPPGFRAIFNGKDLTGWYGLNPHSVVKLTGEKKDEALQKMRDEFASHWRVEDGELVNDGHGPYATTDEDYGDIELLIEYKTVPKADSGIYLRGTPQVQIWDVNQPLKSKDKIDRSPEKGSGGLFNNTPGTLGRDPIVLADKPFGEWNSFRIIQIGAKTWVWLNDKLVVPGVIMENYYDRKQPLAAKGPIMLQTHGGEIRWRNIFVRNVDASEAEKLPKAEGQSTSMKLPPKEQFHLYLLVGQSNMASRGKVEAEDQKPHEIVDAAHRHLAAAVPNAAFVPSDSLVAGPDGIHVDAPSFREFGKRYAEAIKKQQSAGNVTASADSAAK